MRNIEIELSQFSQNFFKSEQIFLFVSSSAVVSQNKTKISQLISSDLKSQLDLDLIVTNSNFLSCQKCPLLQHAI